MLSFFRLTPVSSKGAAYLDKVRTNSQFYLDHAEHYKDTLLGWSRKIWGSMEGRTIMFPKTLPMYGLYLPTICLNFMVNVGKYQNSKRTDSTRPKCQNLAIYYTIYFHGMPCLWMTKRPPKTNTMRLATRRILWSWPSQSVCIVLRACRWDMLNLYRWQFDGKDDHELIVLDLSIVNQPGGIFFIETFFFHL